MIQKNRHLEAAAAFLEVSELFEELGDEYWVVRARANYAASLLDHAEESDLPAAEIQDVCHKILSECDNVIARAAGMAPAGTYEGINASGCRAGALCILGDYEAALHEIEQVLPLATQGEDLQAVVDLEMHAARALEALGRPETVLDRLSRAEELARSADRDRQLTKCLELRANICEARGDLSGALEAHRKYHGQKLRARRSADDIRATVIRALLDAQRAEHELELARAEVESLEAIGRERRRMISIIAHELRNPITTVLGLSDEMSRNWDSLGDEGRQLIAMVRDEAGDLANIVEDLLVAERIEDGSLQVDPEECDLLPLAVGVVEAVPLEGKSIRVEGVSRAYADPARVRQILRNLVTNAVRYGGDEIVVDMASNGSVSFLEVRDNGPGVPEDDRQTIFEPYRRSEGAEPREGSVGLGLAVTRLLARLMGGDVEYDEVPETVFRLTLPALPPP
jgi:signal transduction histidine kinase